MCKTVTWGDVTRVIFKLLETIIIWPPPQHDENMSLNGNRASTKAPNDSGNRDSSQGTDRNNEALIIRRLEQEEKDTNALIMSVRVFGFLLHWHGHGCSRLPR